MQSSANIAGHGHQGQVDDTAARQLRNDLSHSWLRLLDDHDEALGGNGFFQLAKKWPWPSSPVDHDEHVHPSASIADGSGKGNQHHDHPVTDDTDGHDEVAKQLLQHLQNHVEEVPVANAARSAGLLSPRVASSDAPQREIAGFDFDDFMYTPVKQKVDIIKAGVDDGNTPVKQAAKVSRKQPTRRQIPQRLENADFRAAGVDYAEWQKVHSEDMKRRDKCLDLSDLFRFFSVYIVIIV